MIGAGILLLAPALGPRPLQSEDVPDPAPLAPIAGLAGFSSVSRVVFADEKASPHRLETVYLFPDRARWRLFVPGGRPAERLLVYRFGDRARRLEPGHTASSEFEGPARDTSILQMELRRAVMIWPDGFEWEEVETPVNVRERLATAPVFAGTGADRRRIGALMATLDDDGRPSHVAVSRVDGATSVSIEALGVEAWQLAEGRLWPHELVLWDDGAVVWRETVLHVTSRVYFVDAFFVPPDRRSGIATRLSDGREMLSLDLQGITFQERDLASGDGWEAALTKAREWIAEAGEALADTGLAVDAVPTLELDRDGSPQRVILRLTEVQEDPPPGWQSLGDRPGLALALDGLGAIDASLIEGMGRAVPAGSRPGTPYCRVSERDGRRRVQLYLPLVAR